MLPVIATGSRCALEQDSGDALVQSSGTPEPPTEPRGASGVHRRARVLFPWSADPIAEHTAECRLCSELAALQ